MAKRIKLFLYGVPGVGKSTLAAEAPNPFFITTDGNFEWLGLPEKDHTQVFNWEEFKKAASAKYDGYDTIVVDLIEDVFKMKEADYCRRQGIDYVGDEGYGKGFRITRDDFVLEIAKLLGQDKNIILISHETTYVTKDRRGIEHNKYGPSNRLPDYVVDQLEGRVRYFLRCYMKPEEFDGKLIKRRYLSLVPKENEFGIARGIDEYSVPHDIDLDWKTFVDVIGFNEPVVKEKKTIKKVEETRKVEEVKVEPVKEIKEEPVKAEPVKEEPEETEVKAKSVTELIKARSADKNVEEEKTEPIKAEPVKTEPVKTEMTREERLAAIRAKIEANKKA